MTQEPRDPQEPRIQWVLVDSDPQLWHGYVGGVLKYRVRETAEGFVPETRAPEKGRSHD